MAPMNRQRAIPVFVPSVFHFLPSSFPFRPSPSLLEVEEEKESSPVVAVPSSCTALGGHRSRATEEEEEEAGGGSTEIGKRTRRLKMLAAKAGLKDLTARHRFFLIEITIYTYYHIFPTTLVSGVECIYC